MQNEIMQATPPSPARDISVITGEIIELRQQANRMALAYVVEIGRRLTEAKSVLPFGEWGTWLSEKVEFTQSTANNYMRLFEEYGNAQISLFGASVNSQTIANLPYSKALQLLAVPADERESFAEEVDAEHISVRELNEAIRARDEALARAEAAEAKAGEVEEANRKLVEAEAEVKDLKLHIENLVSTVETEKEKREKAKEKLLNALKNPKISPEQLETIKAEAAEEAKKNAAAETEAQLAELKNKLAAAEDNLKATKQASEQAERELAEAQRKLKTASPKVAEFKAYFEQIQRLIAQIKSIVAEIYREDAETAEKLKAALRSVGVEI